jgi:endonuclease/exonuclease/phosphatase (EEP) superfamily protein YafD
MPWVRIAKTLILGPPVFLLAAACAGAAVAAQFGRASDKWDVLAQFAPIWLAGALGAFAAAWIFVGYTRALILGMSAVGVAAAGALILPELLRSTGPKAAPDAPDQLKVIQANLWAGNLTLEEEVAWLVAQKPDVLITEESTPRSRDLIVAATGWHVACPRCQVMIFSPMKPISTSTPPRANSEPPIARATFRRGDGRFTVIGTHYVWPTLGGRQQAAGRSLAQVLDRFDKQRLILAGDFNSAPWSFTRRREDVAFGLIRRTKALFSWPAGEFTGRRIQAPFPFLAIDHVYAGAGWATVKVERGPRLGSDHYPVVVTLAPVALR